MQFTSTRARIVRGGLIAATIAASGAFLSAAPATADPMANPLLASTCTFAQVDAAAYAVAPELAANLDRNPIVKGQIQSLYDQPPRDRAAAVQRILIWAPWLAARVLNAPGYPDFERISAPIAETCHNF